MISIFNSIVTKFVNHSDYKNLKISNLSIDTYNRAVYVNSQVYDEDIMKIVLLIDDGEWFEKTMRFEISTSSYKSEIKVRSGYGENYINFKYKDYKDIADFIISQIITMQNKNFKYIKKVI